MPMSLSSKHYQHSSKATDDRIDYRKDESLRRELATGYKASQVIAAALPHHQSELKVHSNTSSGWLHHQEKMGFPIKEFLLASLLAASLLLSSWAILLGNRSLPAPECDGRFDTFQVPLRLEFGSRFAWFANLTYGTPPQTFKTRFVTSFTEPWVLKSGFNGDPSRGYNALASSTHIRSGQSMEKHYGQIRMKGAYGQDSLSLAPNVVVRNQTLVLLDEIEGRPETANEDMTIGLGYGNPEPAHKDLLENLVEQKLINRPVFAYHISRNTSRASFIHFGRPQESHYTGELHYVGLETSPQVPEPVGWFIRAESIRASGPLPGYSPPWGRRGAYEVCSDPGCRVYVSPGDLFIRGPTLEVILLNSALGATTHAADGPGERVYSYFSCSQAYESPDLVFKFGGREFVLHARDYVMELNGTCISTILTYGQPEWRLGSPFMERYYTVFDRARDRIGFAPKTDADLLIDDDN